MGKISIIKFITSDRFLTEDLNTSEKF